MLLNHSTTSFLFLIRLFFVRDVNEKNIYKYRFVFVKKIQKDIRNALNAVFYMDKWTLFLQGVVQSRLQSFPATPRINPA